MQSCGPFPVDPGSIPRGLVGGPCEPWVPVLRQDNPHGLLAFLVAPPPAPVEAAAPIDLSANLEQAGLVMIETQAKPAATPAEPAPVLGRKPRPAVVIAEEPLQMVETHRP